MRERVKVFTFVSGHGETVVEPRRTKIPSINGLRPPRAGCTRSASPRAAGRERGTMAPFASGTSLKRQHRPRRNSGLFDRWQELLSLRGVLA